ncbi:hypothetical protein [Streptomyces katrae]|uniref:hypothetical protein n=1 Tax=Streptomyces katrae TaxID=68223 RepID=UPI00055D2B1F|nr:hypothetical protein [Streptomyces katrae]
MTPARQHHTRTTRLLAAAAATAALAALATSCTSSAKDDKARATASPSPSASPTASTDPQAAEKAKVLAAYDGFWAESVKAYEKGTDKDTRLVDFAAGSALDETLTDLANMLEAGVAKQGSPGHRPETTTLSLSAERPTATVSDCLDLSSWHTTDRSTGTVRPYPSNQPLRYIAVAQVEQHAGRWMVVKITPNGDRTC